MMLCKHNNQYDQLFSLILSTILNDNDDINSNHLLDLYIIILLCPLMIICTYISNDFRYVRLHIYRSIDQLKQDAVIIFQIIRIKKKKKLKKKENRPIDSKSFPDVYQV
jgi:hypothetical protein